jgi:hypothetical protein
MRAVLAARHEYAFLDPILVECPSCGGCADARAIDENPWGARRVTCRRCHGVKTIAPRGNVFWSPIVETLLPGFQLWLRGQTRHGTLYAYNHDHLDYIADYVSATLRKVDFSTASFRNGSVTSRLPAWVKSTKNRGEVIKTIEKMRRK